MKQIKREKSRKGFPGNVTTAISQKTMLFMSNLQDPQRQPVEVGQAETRLGVDSLMAGELGEAGKFYEDLLSTVPASTYSTA